MKYTDFKKTDAVDLSLLLSLGGIDYSAQIYELDNYPDFDLTKYDKHSEKTYFFFDELDFPDRFNTILRIDEPVVRIFHFNDLKRLSEHHQVDLGEDLEYARFLADIQAIDEDLSLDGYDTDIDGFHLNSVKVSGINNTEKKISVVGGYSAGPMGIQPYDWSLIMFCKILGIPEKSTRENLFLALISEGYSLIRGANYNLSFFIIYSAIECYINTKLNSHEDQCRLSEKMRQLFKTAFPDGDIGNHQIYTSIIDEFQPYTNTRNTIAHGTSAVAIGEKEVRNLLLFALTMIASVELAVSSFQDLKARISHA